MKDDEEDVWLRLGNERLDELLEASRQEGVSPGDLTRHALTEYLDRLERMMAEMTDEEREMMKSMEASEESISELVQDALLEYLEKRKT